MKSRNDITASKTQYGKLFSALPNNCEHKKVIHMTKAPLKNTRIATAIIILQFNHQKYGNALPNYNKNVCTERDFWQPIFLKRPFYNIV
jgi:hypothetical protein